MKRSYTIFSDDELLEYLKKGALGAFEEIYKRYWKLLYGTAYKRLKSKELSEEVVQDIFTSFWNKREAIVIKGSLYNYLIRSVTYHTIDSYRKEAVRNNYTAVLDSNLKLVNSTEDEILYRETKQRITEIVKQLPEKCRMVFELSRYEYKSNKEISFLLGISEKTVENHLSKALKRIRLTINSLLIIYLFV